ncbi:hypothetical protein JG688_00016523 [Phytophthora aleatoria]|uniref:Uncharacterized protein n=1 Tax=Phytophthora aleatoria TaxID=2496075 RepID=A0A8J5IFM1_9STRA|nr:hypothetical protein JG688_00016523 [Phytophthora aleatoria]
MRDNDGENQPAATAGGQEDKQRAGAPSSPTQAGNFSLPRRPTKTMLVRNDVYVRMAETEMLSTRETTLRLRKTVTEKAKGMTGVLSLRVRVVIPLHPATLPALAWTNPCRLRVKLMKASPVETRLGDDAGGNGEAVRRGAGRDGGEVKGAEDPTVGAASEGKVADGDDDIPARESRDDAGDSNASGDRVIEDPATMDGASKEGADATVDADAEGKKRKVAGGDDAEPMLEPGDGVGGSNDYTAGSGTRADTAVGNRDNISPDGDQARGSTYEEKRETCDEKDKGEESSDGELPTHLQFLEEKLPRERHSKTKPEREAMIAAHVNVNNYVGPVLRKGYASWKSWEAGYEEYCRTHRVKYRVRTSKDVDEYNRKHNATEAQFHKYFANYRCKHGVYQEQRGSTLV